jgi:hypothetical protein
MKKRNTGVIYIARKVGAKENGSVNWTNDGKALFLDWISPSGSRAWGTISPTLARLLVKRINQALHG